MTKATAVELEDALRLAIKSGLNVAVAEAGCSGRLRSPCAAWSSRKIFTDEAKKQPSGKHSLRWGKA